MTSPLLQAHEASFTLLPLWRVSVALGEGGTCILHGKEKGLLHD